MTRVVLGIVLLAAGCASATPERAYYLVRAPVDGSLAPADRDALAGVGPVRVAPYLKGPGVVVQVAENRVRPARYHLWAEPLDRGIRAYLEDRVSSMLGRALNMGANTADAWHYRFDVTIEEFHGKLDGEVRLVGRWSLVDAASNRALETQRFNGTRMQAGDGYPGLVESQIALLDELAETLARALRVAERPM